MAAKTATCRSTSIRRPCRPIRLSATDVQNAIANQNQIIPAGNVKIGSYQYMVQLNDAPQSAES